MATMRSQRPSVPIVTSTPPPLDAVDEDGAISPIWKLPPSLQTRSSSYKGKSRDVSSSRPVSNRLPAYEWSVNAVTTREGIDEWKSRDRIILVLGQPSPESLSPLLYDDTFQDTLLLIGTPTPDPAIQALLAGSDAKPIRPIVRTFSPSTDGNATSALLKEAQSIAQNYRSRRAKSSRRMSSLSLGRESPSPSFKRMSLYSGSASSLPRSGSDLSISGRRQGKSDRPSLNPLPSASLFDAIVNFLYSPALVPQKAMQEILHQTMVVTTGLWPILMANTDPMSELPISLLHILPSGITGAVPHVVEDYLVRFAANTADGMMSAMRSLAVHSSVWRTPVVELATGPIPQNLSGASVLLFNGLAPLRARALVSRWKSCVDISMIPLEEPRPRFPHQSSSLRYSSKEPTLYTITQPPDTPGYTSQQLESGLETPDLDHAGTSSSSSTSESAEHTESTLENGIQRVRIVGDGEEAASSQPTTKASGWKRLFGKGKK